MIRRLFWLGAGLAIGALVVRKLTRTAESLTPAGIAGSVQDSAADLLDTVREFVADVRDGMAERESELLDALAGEDGHDNNGFDKNGYDDNDLRPESSGRHTQPGSGQH